MKLLLVIALVLVGVIIGSGGSEAQLSVVARDPGPGDAMTAIAARAYAAAMLNVVVATGKKKTGGGGAQGGAKGGASGGARKGKKGAKGAQMESADI